MDVAQAMQGSSRKHDVPLDQLDFGYIKECSDVKRLEKILKVLRSKEEGFYPDLERCCEGRLKDLHPNSRLLRKESRLYSKGDLGSQEREKLDQDLKSWTSDMKNMESNIGEQFEEFESEDQDLPPIRSGSITLTADGAKSSKPQSTNPSKKPMPREYRDWDKIDVEAELKKVDQADGKGKEKTFIANREVTNIPNKIDTKGLSDSEKLMKANREKDKGNEAFRSNDFKEAITYYSRSISLQPTAASFNNRALAYLKISEWQKAIDDTKTVLEMEPDNVKAFLRRVTAYKGLRQLQKAKSDIDCVLQLDPDNKKAQELLVQVEKERKEKKKTGRRMIIEDVEGDDSTEDPEISSQGDNSASGASKVESKDREGNSVNGSSNKSSEKAARRMEITEVDSESEEKDENADDVVVNGHISVQEVIKNEEKTGHGKVEQTLKEEKEEQKLSEPTDDRPVSVEVLPKTATPKAILNDNQSVEEISSSDVDTADDRSSPVAAEEETLNSGDIEEEKESSDIESSEAETVEAVEDFKRPVFYMKEMPGKASSLKAEATTLFRSGQYGDACEKYDRLIRMLENESQIVNLSLMYSNRAACHLKTGDLPGAVKDCNASLKLIPHSVKPLLRRAIAYEHLERFRPAYIDYRHVLLLDTRMDQAHQGTKRCQHILSQKDGPRWREKVHLPKVSPFEIPDVIGLDGKSTAPVVINNPPAVNQLQSTCASSSQSKESISKSAPVPLKNIEDDVQVNKDSKVDEKIVKEDMKQTKLSPQEKFDSFKFEGNELVKQSKFKEAIESYNKCEEVLPDQVVVYTNRALCYIRTNQAKNAEEDCSKALTLEKENVKALFRRAQARKMLKLYREGIEDLKHLLQVDPKNSAAIKEMELLKNYWRDELENMKKNLDNLKSKKDDLISQKSEKSSTKSGTQSNAKSGTQSATQSSTQSGTQSKIKSSTKSGTQSNAKSGTQSGTQSSTQTGTQSSTQSGTQSRIKSSTKSGTKSSTQSTKQRKRMIIQEVESDEENKPKDASDTSGKDTNPKVEVINTDAGKPTADSKPDKEAKNSSQTGSNKKDLEPSQKKSAIKETSQGLPSIPKTAPKLEKATPYEFISAWNALKKSETVKPHYDLLKQIKPSDIQNVISNKLDGGMLYTIVRCVADHYMPNGEGDTTYELLKSLSAVPRFRTVSMFMSQNEKSEVLSVMNKLESLPSKVYSQEDISKLRKLYIV